MHMSVHHKTTKMYFFNEALAEPPAELVQPVSVKQTCPAMSTRGLSI